MTARPTCPTCSAVVRTARPVEGGLAIAYPCTCWMPIDTAEDLWSLYPDTDPERTPPR